MIKGQKILLVLGELGAVQTTSNRSPGDKISLSTTNGSTGNPSVAITVKFRSLIYNKEEEMAKQ